MTNVELCIKSNFTFLKGGSHPEEYVYRAIELGLDSFAITDENSVAGIVKAFTEIRKVKKKCLTNKKIPKLISGTEIITKEQLKITALVKNRKGWSNLCRLLTKGKKKEKGLCNININDILKFGHDMVLLLHMPSRNLSDRRFNEWLKHAKKIIVHLPEIWLVISPKYDGLDNFHFAKTEKISKRLGIGLVASAYPVMHHSSRRPILDVLSAIRKKSIIDNLGYKASKNAERRLRSSAELKNIFINYECALINSKAIADSCQFSLDELKHEYPSEISSGEQPHQKLVRLTKEGLGWRYSNSVPNNVKKQVQHELELIDKLNYSPYFLTVFDIVKFAKSRDILCQGRGSAANSIVCFALGITSVSPEIGTMIFERFVSEARNEPPDIDIDFEHERREEVIQYIYKKFGRNRTGLCATIVHYRSKQATREVGKVMGLSEDTISLLSSQLSEWKKTELSEKNLKQIGLDLSNRRLRQTIYLIKELNGFPKHLGQHVGGFIFTENRLDELIPIENARKKNRTIICWDKNDIDMLGILKVDILSLGILTCIKKAFALIHTFYGLDYTLSTVPPEDENTYDMLCRADTVGVFQVESRAQMNFLPRMKPRCFYDLVIEIAIVRPGPIQGNMVHPYLKRRMGKEKITFPSRSMQNVLEKTLGIPLFQEQAMQIAIVGAGFTPNEADDFRRALVSFNRNISTFREKFISGMVSNGYEETYCKKCFTQIEGFGEYGFPESHAASFAFLVYASAWIKNHYPGIFACSILNSQPMGFYASSQIINDVRNHNVKVKPICINNSLWDSTMEPNGTNDLELRIGFRQIKGLQKKEVLELIKARGDGYKSIYDVWNRSNMSYKSILKIIKADCFNILNLSRQNALWKLQTLKSKNKLPLFQAYREGENIKEKKIILPKIAEGDNIIKDYNTLNFTLRCHPMALLRPILNQLDSLPTVNKNNTTITS